MRPRRIQCAALFSGCLLIAGQAFAQTAPKAPDVSDEFLLGLRRVGVMAGQAVECAPAADRQNKIAEAMDLANQIAIHFGLKAAFNYAGAVGYGSGRPFDKAGCAQSIAGWKEVVTKYSSK